jgi:DNA-binding transcriptional ArsR family regulator
VPCEIGAVREEQAMSHDAALAALGDPTRRAIVERLRGGPMSVGRLADDLPVSRPAVSKHLRVLEASRLVTHVRQGTRSLYRIDSAGLDEVRRYVDSFWTDVLSSFADHLGDRSEPDQHRSPTSAPTTTSTRKKR